MDLGGILDVLLKFAVEAVDSLVKGEDVGSDGIKAIQAVYGLLEVYDDLVTRTDNKIDDFIVENFNKLAEDTAKEGNFPLLMLVDVE